MPGFITHTEWFFPFRIGSDNIQFSWNSPDKSECENFNAQLDGYIYELKGNSPWNKNRTFLQKDVRKPTNSLSVFFSSLMPFSKYNLTVYTKSAEGLYNSNMPLNLSAETKPDEKAGTPRDLKVIETVDGSKHQASWLPPYPPTGEGKLEFFLNTKFFLICSMYFASTLLSSDLIYPLRFLGTHYTSSNIGF